MRISSITSISILALFLSGCGAKMPYHFFVDQSYLISTLSIQEETPTLMQRSITETEIVRKTTEFPRWAGDGCYYWLADNQIPDKSIEEILQKTEIPNGIFREKYHIVGLAYGDNVWMLTFDRHIDTGLQLVISGKELPIDDIEKAITQGYEISNIVFGTDGWVVIASEKANYSSQKIAKYYYFPEEEISEMRKNGFWVTNIEYDGGTWVVIFSQTDYILDQKIISSPSFSWAEIQNAEKIGFLLLDQVYAKKKWTLLLSKRNKEMISQEISAVEILPKDIIQQYWFRTETVYTNISPFYGEGKWFIRAWTEKP